MTDSGKGLAGEGGRAAEQEPGRTHGMGRAGAVAGRRSPTAEREQGRAPRAWNGDARAHKFRQAAFWYLHVGLLYEAAVVAMWRNGLVNPIRGPIVLWLLLGAAIVALVFWGLWFRRSVWLARGIWALHALRLPSMIEGAFLPGPDAALSVAFYLTAIVVIVINLWMLARAGWDL